MASDDWSQNNNSRFNFRPGSGNYRNPSHSGQRRGTRPYNRISHNSVRGQEQQQERFSTSTHVHQYCSYDDSTINDDERTHYAVNLLLKPVEIGLIAKNDSWSQEFKGLGAFNHYFGLCAQGLGYTLPDVWDGYFHITLAKFITQISPQELENVFSRFIPSLEDLPYIPSINFRASSIKRCLGTYRAKDRQNIDFIVLPVEPDCETEAFYTKVQSLLGKIREETRSIKWNTTPLDQLHVTVKKYSDFKHDLNKIKIREFPLEFRCSHLEVKQTREQALNRFKKAASDGSYIWWTGVTEIQGKCSGCGNPVMSDTWEGFCLICGKYETITPLWSTDGKTINHHRPQHREPMRTDNTLSELVQRVRLNEI